MLIHCQKFIIKYAINFQDRSKSCAAYIDHAEKNANWPAQNVGQYIYGNFSRDPAMTRAKKFIK